MEVILDQAQCEARTIATTNEAEEQRDTAVAELSNLELSLVGGGVGAVSFM
jgi:hypothetical protein